ncbi:MAG: hypothetical protein WD276_03805 [Actinomycetota bacterium]
MSLVVRRIRRLALSVAIAVSALAPSTLAAETACAATAQRAVLVIDAGGQSLRYCVAMSSGSVSGLDLIKLAGAQYGLQYRLGFGGQAVCQLAGLGPASGDCFGDYPDFWGYWRGTGGGWSWSGAGAGSTVVHSGDIEGWSWGSGDGGSGHPEPPATDFGEVCTGAPGGSGQGDELGDSPTSMPGSGLGPTPEETRERHRQKREERRKERKADRRDERRDDRRDDRRRERRRERRRDEESIPLGNENAVVTQPQALGDGSQSDSSPGPPAGALLAIAAVVALTAGGFLIKRRRE